MQRAAVGCAASVGPCFPRDPPCHEKTPLATTTGSGLARRCRVEPLVRLVVAARNPRRRSGCRVAHPFRRGPFLRRTRHGRRRDPEPVGRHRRRDVRDPRLCPTVRDARDLPGGRAIAAASLPPGCLHPGADRGREMAAAVRRGRRRRHTRAALVRGVYGPSITRGRS